MTDHAILEIAAIGLAAILCQWIAWRVRLPAILFLLLAGIVAGPVASWLDADQLFGELLLPFISLSVAVILFEGSLTLQFHQIRGLERVVRNMVSVGVLVSWLAITLTARWVAGLSWELAFLFGAVTLVTGPTVITPLLRTVRPVQSVAHILRWEGIVVDPIGALLAVLVFEFIAAGGGALGHTFFTFGSVVVIGLAFGLTAGYALGEVLRRAWLPDYLESFATLTLVFGVFAISNAFAAESGLISVTAMGIWLANRKGLVVEEILAFKENLSLLLISALFIILAARLDLGRLGDLGPPALLVLLSLQFIVRPLMVAVSTWRSSLSWRERALLAWIAPRGIVAAAVSALFAIRLGQFGYADADVLLSLTFFVIIGTVVLQSATAGTLARWLGVAEPEPMGFLIVGANSIARAIGKALLERKVPVLLTDINWENVSQARMAGLPVYFGSPISEHAAHFLETTGLGRLLAMSPDENFNLLALTRYRGEFGRNAMYELRVWPAGVAMAQHEVAAHHKGRTLFGGDVTYGTLARMLNHGAEIRTTKLTESFNFEQYLNAHRHSAIPLFAAGPKGRFEAFSSDSDLKPVAGWTILSLVPPDSSQQASPPDQADGAHGSAAKKADGPTTGMDI